MPIYSTIHGQGHLTLDQGQGHSGQGQNYLNLIVTTCGWKAGMVFKNMVDYRSEIASIDF